ncbi:hypothetical protein FIBSPDRAFT_877597 [Athelia psychrophila]|uniref:F-box domain-containing protein n=1 Tax=Athelia psychrophila TaxID=1759441 RepID=A0A167VUI0_9AGAM|nr:hypothetical protein FIBSPDRAFT_877597 [Fibularhizoctonia sp. CBS 109695]
MHHIPLELWGKIFENACVDGGRTGASLALVSRGVHDASQHCRYYSVALRGLPSALKFAQLLGKHRIHEIQVYHLYVTYTYPYAYLDDSRSPIANKTHGIPSIIFKIAQKVFKEMAAEKNVVQKALKQNPHLTAEGLMHATLFTILLAVAPTLTTLSLCINLTFRKPAVPSLPFLTELTLRYAFGWRTCSIAQVLGTFTRLPSLRMLDLLGLACYAKPEEIMVEAARVAPNMTHICLPIIRAANLHDMNPATNITFWERLDGGDLVIQMQLDPWYERAEIYTSNNEWSRRWNLLTREAGWRPGFVFYIREKPVDECYEEQQENWLARISGGTGRWVYREEDLGKAAVW